MIAIILSITAALWAFSFLPSAHAAYLDGLIPVNRVHHQDRRDISELFEPTTEIEHLYSGSKAKAIDMTWPPTKTLQYIRGLYTA